MLKKRKRVRVSEREREKEREREREKEKERWRGAIGLFYKFSQNVLFPEKVREAELLVAEPS